MYASPGGSSPWGMALWAPTIPAVVALDVALIIEVGLLRLLIGGG